MKMGIYHQNGGEIMVTKFLRKMIKKIEERGGHCSGDTGGTGHCS